MLVWALGTIATLAGVTGIAVGTLFPRSLIAGTSPIVYISLLIGGFAVIIISETVYGIKKTKMEMDKDDAIKTAIGKNMPSPTILAICPNCKSRIPSDSKYCLECGTDVRSQ
jgi:hypothetical protein